MVFVLNSCEEGLGNLKGIRAIMARYGASVKAFFTFDGKYNAVVDRSVGSHRYNVTVKTKGGHSFNDFGNENAARVLAKGIQMIYRISVPEGGKTTYNVGLISGGTSVNTIVQEDSMLCEYRSDVYENLEYMQIAFGKVFAAMKEDACLDVELVGDRPGMKNVDPVEQKELPIFYSLGDFILQLENCQIMPDDYYCKYGLRPDAGIYEVFKARTKNFTTGLQYQPVMMEAVIPCFEIEDGKLKHLEMIPIELGVGMKHSQIGWPRIAKDDSILQRLAKLSAPFGTKMWIEDGKLIIK